MTSRTRDESASTPPARPRGPYDRAGLPLAFDALISAMFAPFGGITQLRTAAVDCMRIEPGMEVVEFGCGTGGVTQLLVQRGAVVTAIDGAAAMLARARRRAPAATYMHGDLRDLVLPAQSFDAALAAFVLHELPAEVRAKTLATAARALRPGGRLVLLDHAVPDTGAIARPWRAFLLRVEPPTVRHTITRGYADELLAAGFRDIACERAAAGTACVWSAVRP